MDEEVRVWDHVVACGSVVRVLTRILHSELRIGIDLEMAYVSIGLGGCIVQVEGWSARGGGVKDLVGRLQVVIETILEG